MKKIKKEKTLVDMIRKPTAKGTIKHGPPKYTRKVKHKKGLNNHES